MVKLVGILNVTPDSFSDGGNFFTPEHAREHARALFADGAYMVDVGAESTRPNAEVLTSDQEWGRLSFVLAELLREFPGRISLDTYHSETVRKAFQLGPVIVNDVTGLQDVTMQKTVAELHPPKVIVSHLPRGTVAEAHNGELLTSITQVRDELQMQVESLVAIGIDRQSIILDPGIGFGKTMELNEQLLTFAELVPEYEVMIGYSRKRFLGEHRMELEPNIEAAKVAIAHGASYLRVHDVAGHVKFLAEHLV